jgi:Domain of unknown function (DUF4136)
MSTRRLAIRWSAAISAGLAAAALAGCASFKTLVSEVSTFGNWPAGRPAGTYVIERLPSQQAAPAGLQADVEQGAHQALQSAGFAPAPEGAAPEVVVQVGARVSRYDRSPWDDPLWWRPYGGPRWGGPGWAGPWGPYWAWRWRSEPSEYQREVGVLIRDKASGQPLYEARARTDGFTAGGPQVIAAMFSAALKDFPKVQNEAHDVGIQLP